MRVAMMVVGVAAAVGLAGVGGWYLRDNSGVTAKVSEQEIQSAVADGIKTAEAYIAWRSNPNSPAVVASEIRTKRTKLILAMDHPELKKAATDLYRMLDDAEKELDRIATLPATAAESVNLRIGYARKVEITLLAQGFDAHVELSEPNKLGLIIRYVAMSRPLVHRFNTDDNLRSVLKSIGFKALTLTDGRRLWETFDL